MTRIPFHIPNLLAQKFQITQKLWTLSNLPNASRPGPGAYLIRNNAECYNMMCDAFGYKCCEQRRGYIYYDEKVCEFMLHYSQCACNGMYLLLYTMNITRKKKRGIHNNNFFYFIKILSKKKRLFFQTVFFNYMQLRLFI